MRRYGIAAGRGLCRTVRDDSGTGGVNRTCRSSARPQLRYKPRVRQAFNPQRGCSTATGDIPRRGMSCSRPRGRATSSSQLFWRSLGELTAPEFQQLRASADLAFINQGITFSVYADHRGVEKIFPFDLIPRPVSAEEWKMLEAGLLQRIQALNLFLHDIYHDRRILREGVIPEDLVLLSASLPTRDGRVRPARQPVSPRGRHRSDPRSRGAVPGARGQRADPVGGQLRPGEPGGHEEDLSRLFQDYPRPPRRGLSAAAAQGSGSVARAGGRSAAWSCCRPGRTIRPTSSTASWPGTWGSSWSSGPTWSSTTTRSSSRRRAARSSVDVIYRRIDDDYLDPEGFRPDSMLGVPDLMRA